MIPISEEEEEQIDNIEKRTIIFTRGNTIYRPIGTKDSFTCSIINKHWS